MKTKKLLFLRLFVYSVLTPAAVFAQHPCDGEPQAICSKALVLSEEFAQQNFRAFGEGARRIFRGELHTIDHIGTERKGSAIGKNMRASSRGRFSSPSDILFQGVDDSDLLVATRVFYEGPTSATLEKFDPDKMKVSFETVIRDFWGVGYVKHSDPNIKATIDQLGNPYWMVWTLLNIEAQDVVITSRRIAEVTDTGLLKNISMAAVLPPTLRDLVDASIVPSVDFDLKAAVNSGALQVGADAVLTNKSEYRVPRSDIPDAELPEKCRRAQLPEPDPSECSERWIRVVYESSTRIPVSDLSKATVEKVKTAVLECW